MQHPVTLNDVARASGVSASTVSRALRNHPHVRKDVAARVLRAAARVGYRPNPLVVALMQQIRVKRSTGFHGNLAYLDWCADRRDFEAFPVLRRFFNGARDTARANGYHLEHFFPIADGITKSTLMRMLRARGMDGAVMFIYVKQDPRTRAVLHPIARLQDLPLELDRLATAVIGGRFHESSPHFSHTDLYAAGRLVAENLHPRGYRRPGLLFSSYIDFATEHRFHAGLHAFFSRAPGIQAFRTLNILESDFSTCVAWVREQKIDVVISYTSDLLPVLRQGGLRVPEDIGFVSFDTQPDAIVSGLDQRHERVGSAAVSLVINQLNRGERGLPTEQKGVVIEGDWVEGTTLRPLPVPR